MLFGWWITNTFVGLKHNWGIPFVLWSHIYSLCATFSLSCIYYCFCHNVCSSFFLCILLAQCFFYTLIFCHTSTASFGQDVCYWPHRLLSWCKHHVMSARVCETHVFAGFYTLLIKSMHPKCLILPDRRDATRYHLHNGIGAYIVINRKASPPYSNTKSKLLFTKND